MKSEPWNDVEPRGKRMAAKLAASFVDVNSLQQLSAEKSEEIDSARRG